MDLAALDIFVDVVKRKSFAAVARARGLAPSSVSRSVATLERDLGIRLFQRTTRKLAPTPAGLAYFERVQPLVAEIEAASHAASASSDAIEGTVRLTASAGFAQAALVPLLPKLARAHPALSFDLVLTEQRLDLIEERIDLAFRLGTLPDSTLVAHRLCDLDFVVTASPAYLRRHGKPRHPRDLAAAGHECLRYPMPNRPPLWRFRDEAGGVEDVAVRARVTAASGVALCDLAVAGMGLLLLPRWNVAAALKSGALVEVLGDYEAALADFDLAAWMLWPSRAHVPRRVRATADFFKSAFSAAATTHLR